MDTKPYQWSDQTVIKNESFDEVYDIEVQETQLMNQKPKFNLTFDASLIGQTYLIKHNKDILLDQKDYSKVSL